MTVCEGRGRRGDTEAQQVKLDRLWSEPGVPTGKEAERVEENQSKWHQRPALSETTETGNRQGGASKARPDGSLVRRGKQKTDSNRVSCKHDQPVRSCAARTLPVAIKCARSSRCWGERRPPTTPHVVPSQTHHPWSKARLVGDFIERLLLDRAILVDALRTTGLLRAELLRIRKGSMPESGHVVWLLFALCFAFAFLREFSERSLPYIAIRDTSEC